MSEKLLEPMRLELGRVSVVALVNGYIISTEALDKNGTTSPPSMS